LKVGVHIKADLTRLFKDCGFTPDKDEPFIGALELGSLARLRQLVDRANVSLVDLAATVLHRHLPKDQSIRISTDWDQSELRPDQVKYAALDAYAILAVYDALRSHTTSGPVTETTLGGTSVKLVSRDHQTTIAYGLVAIDQPPKFDGVNVTKTRTIINVTVVIVPAYLVRAELLKSRQNTPLSSFGHHVPFQLLCSRKDLQLCSSDEYQHALTTVRCPLPPPSLPVPHDDHSQLIGTSDDAVHQLDHGWMEHIDFDADQEQNLTESSPDSAAETQSHTLDRLPRLPPLDSPIRSRVLGDIYHLMAMFKITVHHGLRRPFARDLRDALLLPDAADKAAVSNVLQKKMMTYELAVRCKSEWVWQRVRRYIPPPEILLPRVKLVFQTYGPLCDAVTHQPLFNDVSWEKARCILENIRLGYYSDPPGVALYTAQGKDMDGLTLYKCLRGTNHVEGGVHQNIAKRFGSYNASPRFAVNLLRDYCLTHNLRVSHFSSWLVLCLTVTLYPGRNSQPDGHYL
jgi:hypothetical protein